MGYYLRYGISPLYLAFDGCADIPLLYTTYFHCLVLFLVYVKRYGGETYNKFARRVAQMLRRPFKLKLCRGGPFRSSFATGAKLARKGPQSRLVSRWKES